MNPYGVLNLSNFSYSGTNAALVALASNTSGSDTLSFQFLPSNSLTLLTADGTTHATTFSGSVTAVPEPALGAALLGVVALAGPVLVRRRLAAAPVA